MGVPALPNQAGVPTERWRVVVALPPPGQLALMSAWLDKHCGRAGWSAAPAGRVGVVNDAVALYFDNRAAARAFIARFCCGYRA